MREAIKRAIEGGYLPSPAVKYCGANNDKDGWSVWEMENGSSFCQTHSQTLLDPEFWKSLGKTEKWEELEGNGIYPVYRDKWHNLIDHLVAEEDVESFFKELLK